MILVLYRFGRNLRDCFNLRNIPWHLLAIAGTYVLVTSGFDWQYFKFFQGSKIFYFFFSAAAIGGLVPILAPLILLEWGIWKKRRKIVLTAYMLAQAVILGSLISSAYKVFTGRVHPEGFLALGKDISQVFHFGFLKGGIFWGWPSSHTTIAFAMAVALTTLYPTKKVMIASLLYAFFIGIGVSMTIHWFSDFFAGAIIGSVIGLTVGKSFKEKL